MAISLGIYPTFSDKPIYVCKTLLRMAYINPSIPYINTILMVKNMKVSWDDYSQYIEK